MSPPASAAVAYFWEAAYALGLTPWDTGVVPPELRRVLADGTVSTTGRALDIGCGTGTNSLYLAQHGFEVLGMDLSRTAIRRARRRIRRAGEPAQSVAGEPAQFVAGDVTRLHLEGGQTPGSFSMMLDIGCYHGLDESGRESYMRMVEVLLGRSGILMQYIRLAGTDHATGSTNEEATQLPGPRRALSRRSMLFLVGKLMRHSRPPYPRRSEVEDRFGQMCHQLSVEEGWEQGLPSAWFVWRRQ